jgi:deazaflavin-dependent oxidoreductase (nitroreductase family)
VNDAARAALQVDHSTPMEERTIDITTTGRRSGDLRRIETVFYRVDDEIYLTGIPSDQPRAWLLNLAAEPHVTFHLKRGVTADLPATATVVTDAAERRRVLAPIVADFNVRNGPGSEWGEAALDDWVARSPLARISFEDAD